MNNPFYSLSPQTRDEVLKEYFGFNDAKAAISGFDSEGNALGIGQRFKAGAMAAFGYLPVGRVASTGGRAVKGAIKSIEEGFGVKGVHRLQKHGSGTTLAQQQYRATTGIAPNLERSGPVDATRFFDNRDLATAYSRAIKTRQPGQRSVPVIFPYDVGEGYYRGGKIYGTTRTVVVTFDANGKIVSAYPKLPKLPK